MRTRRIALDTDNLSQVFEGRRQIELVVVLAEERDRLLFHLRRANEVALELREVAHSREHLCPKFRRTAAQGERFFARAPTFPELASAEPEPECPVNEPKCQRRLAGVEGPPERYRDVRLLVTDPFEVLLVGYAVLLYGVLGLLRTSRVMLRVSVPG